MSSSRILSGAGATLVIALAGLSACGGSQPPTSSVAGAATSGPATAPPSSAPAAATPAPTPTPAAATPARAGSYPVQVTVVEGASRSANSAVLTVSPAAADGTQTDALGDPGAPPLLDFTLGFQGTGQVMLVSVHVAGASGQSNDACASLALTFTPPVQMVPAPLATGATWSGPAVSGAFAGSINGLVTAQAVDTVAGVAIPVFKIHGSVTLAGTACTQAVTLTYTLDADWAPSVGVPLSSTLGVVLSATNVHAALTLVTQVTSTTPR